MNQISFSRTTRSKKLPLPTNQPRPPTATKSSIAPSPVAHTLASKIDALLDLLD